MQQGRNADAKVAPRGPVRWYVHTSHRMQAFATNGYDSLQLASEAAADALTSALYELTGYRIEAHPLLVLDYVTIKRLGVLPLERARIDADARMECNGEEIDEDDVREIMASRIALAANSAGATGYRVEIGEDVCTVQRSHA